MLTIGSLCTGIGGLDLAVERHFGAELLWYSDIDPKANQVMAVQRPHAWALGDFTKIDPATVKVPDILTGGFPCQPVSSAGKQKGTADERWLFDDIVTFIEGLWSRPTWVVLENVRNLLSHDQGRTALGVVREVARLGYDVRWGVVRASDTGLPHKRERWFCVATHADALGTGRGRPRQVPGTPGTGEGQGPEWQRLRPAAGHGGPTPTDADGPGGEARLDPGRSRQRVRVEPVGSAAPATDAETPADADGSRGPTPEPSEPPFLPVEGGGSAGFGPYTAAIYRWWHHSGRPIPAPVVDERLNPRFVEWMMGHEAGLVTDVITTRTHALRLLGNSVCPPQAALALELLTQ